LVDKAKLKEWFDILHSEIDKFQEGDRSEPVSREDLFVVLKSMYCTLNTLRECISPLPFSSVYHNGFIWSICFFNSVGFFANCRMWVILLKAMDARLFLSGKNHTLYMWFKSAYSDNENTTLSQGYERDG